MKLGLPILWADQHRLRGPGRPVSIGVLDRVLGLGVRRLRERTPLAAAPRRAGASRDAGRAHPAGLVTARVHCAANLAAAHDAAPVDNPHDAGSDGTPAGVRIRPGRSGDAGSVFVPGALTLRRATALPTGTVQQGGPDLTMIGAPVAKTLAGVKEGATRA
jgi:hypothetical protein